MRGCGRKTDDLRTCDSVLIPVTMNYSIVCGRIYSYQRSDSYAFYYSVVWSPIELGVPASIDSSYVWTVTHSWIS